MSTFHSGISALKKSNVNNSSLREQRAKLDANFQPAGENALLTVVDSWLKGQKHEELVVLLQLVKYRIGNYWFL